MADWWATSFPEAAGNVGDAFTVRFGKKTVKFVVSQIVPAQRMAGCVTDCNLHFIEDKKEWKGSSVVFDASSQGAATSVTMTHAGLVPGVECCKLCRTGWELYIREGLQKLLPDNHEAPDGSGRRQGAVKSVRNPADRWLKNKPAMWRRKRRQNEQRNVRNRVRQTSTAWNSTSPRRKRK